MSSSTSPAAGETRTGYDEELRDTVFEGLLKYSHYPGHSQSAHGVEGAATGF